MSKEIKITLPGNRRVDADYKGFHIPTDQPLYDGGDNSFPAPFDLFMVSIATCAGYYAMTFCQSRNIPTENITLTQKSEYDPEIKRIGKIKIEAQLPPDFPEKYKKAIIRAIESCTVKKLIQNAPVFETTTVTKKSNS